MFCSEPSLCCCYSPPYVNADFLPKFSDFMLVIMLNCDKISITGDFNIHKDDSQNKIA